MGKMNKLISIIIPVYNTESFIKECIESVLKQTYRNLEIILVDDGSPDGSGHICDVYAERDSRIKVIHKLNGGLSDARNVGIKIAQGKYLIFIDSDDCVAERMVEKLYLAAEEEQADMAMCNFEYIYEKGVERNSSLSDSPIKNEVLLKEEVIDKLFQDKAWYYIVAWNKIYKRELWKDLHYPKGYIYEDEAVIHRLLNRCNKVVTLEEKLYYYRQVQGSIMHCDNKEKRLDIYFALADRILYLHKKISEEKMRMLFYKYWNNFFEDYYKCMDNSSLTIYLRRMKKTLIKVLPVFAVEHFFTVKDILGILIFLVDSKIYRKKYMKKRERF